MYLTDHSVQISSTSTNGSRHLDKIFCSLKRLSHKTNRTDPRFNTDNNVCEFTITVFSVTADGGGEVGARSPSKTTINI